MPLSSTSQMNFPLPSRIIGTALSKNGFVTNWCVVLSRTFIFDHFAATPSYIVCTSNSVVLSDCNCTITKLSLPIFRQVAQNHSFYLLKSAIPQNHGHKYSRNGFFNFLERRSIWKVELQRLELATGGLTVVALRGCIHEIEYEGFRTSACIFSMTDSWSRKYSLKAKLSHWK